MLTRLLKLFLAAIFYIIRECVRFVRRSIGRSTPSSSVVLMYHAVKTDKLEDFKKHMDLIMKIGNPAWADSVEMTSDARPKIAVTFDDGFRSVVENALPIMQERGIPATIFIPTGYIGKKPDWKFDSPDDVIVDDKVLNETQLRGLDHDLVKVGSHSVTHSRLPQLGQKEANKELMESKKALENILGKSIDLFAFPYGDYNEETIKLCIKVGYRCIFIATPMWGSSANNGTVRGRIDISLNDWCFEYRLKMLGAYEWLPWAIRLKGKLLSAIKGVS